MFILDTNVLSEMMRPEPNPSVWDWLSGTQATDLFTTAICQAEILAGLAVMANRKRRAGLETLARSIFLDDFDGRLLPFDSAAAAAYAEIFAACRTARGMPSLPDRLIAAIALSRHASVVTRNVKDFARCGVPIINPWDA